jgi:hypothetical protein
MNTTNFPIVKLYRLDTAQNIIAYNAEQSKNGGEVLDFDAMFHFIRSLPEDEARKLLSAYMQATDSDSILGWSEFHPDYASND